MSESPTSHSLGDPALVLPKAYYEDLYSEDFYTKRGTWRPWRKQGGKHLMYAALLLAKGRILDIGCGAGHLAAMFRDFGRADDYAAGIDYCKSAIRIARHHAPKAHFVVGNAETHPDLLKSARYDTAVILEVLEHIYEDRQLLAMIPVERQVVLSVPSFRTDGHCRWFGNQNEVRARYRDLLEIHRVIVEEGIASDNRFFVLKGRRR